MREILFRGKFSEKSRWSYGDLYTDHGKVYIATRDMMHGVRVHEEVIPDTVGQFTGLMDNHGRKIFEGDIVRYAIYPPDQFVHGVVNYKDGVFRIGDQGCALCVCAADGIDEYRLEVIGNIHDNPEFLKVGEA